MPISSPPAFRFFSPRPSVLAVAMIASLQSAAVWAIEPFELRDIRVEGLQRIEAGTVFASLPFRIGDTYTDDKGAAALRALFATGLFQNVRLEVDGKVLVVIVEERPAIAGVDFVGLKEFDREVLLKALRDIGISEGRPFNRALVDRAEQELKRQYLTRSLYGAEVATTVTPQEGNRVNETFTVNEGGVARIRELHITGNQAYSDRELRDLFELSTGGWLTWYTKSDRYSRAKLNADLEKLRAFYLNRGYLDFNVEATQVAVSPDKRDISITIRIHEGQRFHVAGVSLEGDYLGKEESFRSLVTIRPGQPYRAEDVAETVRAFSERFGAFGYAFARIEPRPELDRDAGLVRITLAAEPQQRVYVRRIEVAGNNRTRDEVVRRELRQFESSWYDSDKIRLSRDRVDRLGYFTDVNFETNEVPGTGDQVDLRLNVTEKPTGSLMLGASFSSAEKLAFTASVKQDNVFGTGNYLGLELNTSRSNRTVVVSTVDPYFTRDGVSRALDVYYRTTQPLSSQGRNTNYKLVTPGFSVRFGIPFSEYDTVFVGAGVESTRIEGSVASLPNSYFVYREQFGERSTSVPLTLGWSRDGRDSALVPTRGRYQRLNGELGVAGDTRYLRTNYQYQQYIPLSTRFTLGLNGEIGWGKGLAGRPYPIFKNFNAGGLGTVRGFGQGSLGPVDPTGANIGGAKRLNFNSELYVPFPGSGSDRTLRLFGYLDVGNVYGENEKIELSDLRASTGIGLSWISPIGPLKLSYGAPIRKQQGDRIERLQFQIGTAF